MTYDRQSAYPGTRCYVLKMHRDATPCHEGIAGRIENMASGVTFSFNNADELLTCLIRDLSAAPAQLVKE